MALFNDVFKSGNIVTALAIGIGAAIVAPVAMTMLRPLVKSIVKAGLIAYDQGTQAIAEIRDATGEAVSEAQRERDADTQRQEQRQSTVLNTDRQATMGSTASYEEPERMGTA